MTLSTDAVTDRYLVSDIVKMALRGLSVLSVHHEPTLEDTSNAILHLRVLLSELHGYSTRARAVAFHTLTCTANQTTPYSLPDAAIDVVGDAMWSDADQSDPASSELVITQVGRQVYEHQQGKDETDTPSIFYVHKEAYPLQVYFWAWPDEAGTVRFQVKRRVGTALQASDAVDMEEHWASYLVKRLAWYLAPSKAVPLEERILLFKESDHLLRVAKRASNPARDIQMRVPTR